MKASETQLKALLDGQKQYRVPLFQRPYSWKKKPQWETLWRDIEELYESGSQGHFLGSIVTLSLPGTPEGIAPFLLIDGQQRLTTLSVMLAAFCQYAAQRDPTIAERVRGLYLENRYVGGLDKLKVLPTHADRAAFMAIILGNANDRPTLLIQAHDYFRSKLESSAFDVTRLESVLLSQLEVVSITLGPDDNPYRIFESLNGKGMPLTQADLLRNYFFMRLPIQEHEHQYSTVWQPMQTRLDTWLDDFIRDFLVKDGAFVRSGDVYQSWKARLDPRPVDDVRNELETLGKFSAYYQCFTTPEREGTPTLRRRMQRLNRWGGTTTYPFLLKLYNDMGSGRLDVTGFDRILQLIESFLVRRLFANVPTNELNRLFIRLYMQLPGEGDLVDRTWQALSQPGLRWPTDQEFEEAILKYPLYRDSRPDQRKLILESLEESYGHHEQPSFSKLTIEHIMPQTLTPEWRTELGEGAETTHNRLVHTLGNLTLTGYNQPLSNMPFERKRQILTGSHLELNREISAETKWTAEQIRARAMRLADRAKGIWPGPKEV